MSVFTVAHQIIDDFFAKFQTACKDKDHEDLIAITMKAKEWRALNRMAVIGYQTQQLKRFEKGQDVHPDEVFADAPKPKPLFRVLPKPRHLK